MEVLPQHQLTILLLQRQIRKVDSLLLEIQIIQPPLLAMVIQMIQVEVLAMEMQIIQVGETPQEDKVLILLEETRQILIKVQAETFFHLHQIIQVTQPMRTRLIFLNGGHYGLIAARTNS